MFKDTINVQAIGTLKISDKETGTVLVDKRNAIHPGNMAYIMASALGGKPASVNSSGSSPYINWMAFGNGGSSSTTTISYRSPRVFTTYDGLPITSSNSTLYSKTYQQEVVSTVYAPGEDMGGGNLVPENTSKVNFKVEMSHSEYEAMQQLSDPSITTPATDSSTDTTSVTAFTFDEIGLLAGVSTPTGMDETKTLMVTHVTFHPVLLSANRTIVVDYTITVQLS
ncbi:MAG: hypothetical protein CBB97_19355 [Candidatus Endolissoclinum sp. TMED37]|nr:MAG: hypothetical protein CBB97_19355 [Candidatus Endolissoclinum sp. TMED37]|tara:strand:- start:275 stop:949 length:675 start_codon:yes stop_codon:yes gene_type:complete